jgi:hypothetical protein
MISVNLKDATEAFKRLETAGASTAETIKTMRDALRAAADDVIKNAAISREESMRRARLAAGPFSSGVEDQREGRPLFTGGRYTICVKCNGLKFVTDVIWSDTVLTQDEFRRAARLGLSTKDIYGIPGMCKSCLKLDIEPLVTRAIDLEGDVTSVEFDPITNQTITKRKKTDVTEKSIVSVREEPDTDKQVTDRQVGWLSEIGVEAERDIERERRARRAVVAAAKAIPIGVAEMESGKSGDTITVRLTDGVIFEIPNETSGPPQRRTIMINTVARETRYRDRNQRPPFPGKKDAPNDVSKTRARQIVLDED